MPNKAIVTKTIAQRQAKLANQLDPLNTAGDEVLRQAVSDMIDAWGIVQAGIAQHLEAQEIIQGASSEAAQLATLTANIEEVFMRSDPNLIKRMLEVADPSPRASALNFLSRDKLVEWQGAINRVLARRVKNAK